MEISSLGSAANVAIQGMKQAEAKTLEAAQNIAEGSLNPEDVVALSQAAAGFKANAAVLKSTAEQTKSLLDIVA